jgi:hypothetical protein
VPSRGIPPIQRPPPGPGHRPSPKPNPPPVPPPALLDRLHPMPIWDLMIRHNEPSRHPFVQPHRPGERSCLECITPQSLTHATAPKGSILRTPSPHADAARPAQPPRRPALHRDNGDQPDTPPAMLLRTVDTSPRSDCQGQKPQSGGCVDPLRSRAKLRFSLILSFHPSNPGRTGDAKPPLNPLHPPAFQIGAQNVFLLLFGVANLSRARRASQSL